MSRRKDVQSSIWAGVNCGFCVAFMIIVLVLILLGFNFILSLLPPII